MRWTKLRVGARVRLVFEESSEALLVGTVREGSVEEVYESIEPHPALVKLDDPLRQPPYPRVVVRPRHRANLVTFFSQWLAVYIESERCTGAPGTRGTVIAIGALRLL
jgi:hypothetical protein